MRTEVQIRLTGHNSYTPEEPWTTQRVFQSHYVPLADFVLEHLGNGPGNCLVIGSPIFEAEELAARLWRVTYIDVRMPPLNANFSAIQADAATLDFAERSADAVSSTCVLCHAGMGRYGDPQIAEADEMILQNIARVLKSKAKAVIAFGPIASMSLPAKIDNAHRIYNFATAHAMVRKAHLEIIEQRVLDSYFCTWKDFEKDPPTSIQIGRDYLTMALRKP